MTERITHTHQAEPISNPAYPHGDARRVTHVHQPLARLHKYRVPYCPRDCADEQIHWPELQVEAPTAEDAQRIAAFKTGCPVGEATRIDNPKATP